MGPGKGTYGSSSLYVGDQSRRIFLRSAKPVAARVEREHQWPAETVLSKGHRLVGPLASLSEQTRASAPPSEAQPTDRSWPAFRSGTAIRPWERCCCAGESRRPNRHSLA